MGLSTVGALKEYMCYDISNIYSLSFAPSNANDLYDLVMCKSFFSLGEEHSESIHVCVKVVQYHMSETFYWFAHFSSQHLCEESIKTHFTDDPLQSHTYLLRDIFLHFLQVIFS